MRWTVQSERSMRAQAWARAVALLGTLALVGCEGTVSFDLGTTPAADPAINGVFVDIEGVELDGSEGTETVRFDEPVEVDLTNYADGNLFRLFTDEELPDGRYTSIRLLFDEDDEENDAVTWTDDSVFELNVADANASDVSFTVDKDDSSREDILLVLDLRQSLSFDDDANPEVYTLTPVLRAMRADVAGRIAGNVTLDCPSSSPLAQGGAVYLFSGWDRTPDDRDGTGEEPYLTTRVTLDAGTTAIPQYVFSSVPEGDYTIAVTCNGDEDDAATNDDVRFEDVANIEVRAEETETHDFD